MSQYQAFIKLCLFIQPKITIGFTSCTLKDILCPSILRGQTFQIEKKKKIKQVTKWWKTQDGRTCNRCCVCRTEEQNHSSINQSLEKSPLSQSDAGSILIFLTFSVFSACVFKTCPKKTKRALAACVWCYTHTHTHTHTWQKDTKVWQLHPSAIQVLRKNLKMALRLDSLTMAKLSVLKLC